LPPPPPPPALLLLLSLPHLHTPQSAFIRLLNAVSTDNWFVVIALLFSHRSSKFAMSRGRSTANASTAQSSVGGAAADKIVNPFRMPSDEEVFAIRDDERRRREDERKHQLSLPAQEKGTWGSKAFAATGNALQRFIYIRSAALWLAVFYNITHQPSL
jgi:hypothetical protein